MEVQEVYLISSTPATSLLVPTLEMEVQLNGRLIQAELVISVWYGDTHTRLLLRLMEHYHAITMMRRL